MCVCVKMERVVVGGIFKIFAEGGTGEHFFNNMNENYKKSSAAMEGHTTLCCLGGGLKPRPPGGPVKGNAEGRGY